MTVNPRLPEKNTALTPLRKLGYEAGITTESIVYNCFYIYFVIFLTNVVGLNPVMAGTVSLISVCVDAITDPILGWIVDHPKVNPKKFMLVGSAKYTGSTIVTGEAEGGRKVVIFRANDYMKDPEVLINMLKTCHHEFAHTISQAQRYPEEFAEVTSESYTTKWTSVSTEQARHNGFVSNYACKSPGEDFAETLAFLCMYGREWY